MLFDEIYRASAILVYVGILWVLLHLGPFEVVPKLWK